MKFKNKYLMMIVPLVYLFVALLLLLFVSVGVINTLPSEDEQIIFSNESFNETLHDEVLYSLIIAKNFTNSNLFAQDGFVYLSLDLNKNETDSNQTNSEALSYALYWNALDRNKNQFDKELLFIEKYMQHPQENYLMWRLEEDRTAVNDGRNIATDADLRAIKALLIANDYWNNKSYQKKLNEIGNSLENVAITNDKYFTPYGGIHDSGDLWKTNEVWLSYADFSVFRNLAYTRGEPWRAVYKNMKNAFISSQLSCGIYQSGLDTNRKYFSLDNNYSINSLWMMVRASESGDKDLQNSAQKALVVYKKSFYENGVIYTSYDSDCQAASTSDSPWVYALVARAAINLGEEEFSADLMRKLMSFQNTNKDSFFFGAFIEGSDDEPKVTQFTEQESIITMQAYLEKIGRSLKN